MLLQGGGHLLPSSPEPLVPPGPGSGSGLRQGRAPAALAARLTALREAAGALTLHRLGDRG